MRSVKENKAFVVAALNAHFTDGNSYVMDKGNGVIEVNDEEGKLNPFLEFCADQLSDPGSKYSEYFTSQYDEKMALDAGIDFWKMYEKGLIDAKISKDSTISKIYVEEFGDGHVWGK